MTLLTTARPFKWNIFADGAGLALLQQLNSVQRSFPGHTHYTVLCAIITRYNGVHLAPVQLNEMHNKFQFYSTEINN